ncbi:MAG: purine/pyrimidine permease [Alistipes sp.]|nr:purine/pyrimidine permease [Alistipes sp.]
MNLKFGIDDRPRFGQLMLYSLQWFVLAIAVVTTSLFIAVGSPAERVLYAQKVFALMGVTTILQVFWGHRMPIVVGPAAVLLVGIITALASQGEHVDTAKIYTSLIVGGAIVTLVAAGRLLERIQRIFTPRIVVVILMLIAFTLSPTIRNLIFPAGQEARYSFGLWFTIIGVFAMAIASHTARGVWKSIVIPAALVIGSVVYYIIYGGFGEVFASYTESDGALLLPNLSFDGGMIAAFFFCYVALLINDIGSIQSLGAMLETPDTDKRCRRGIGITGIMNMVSGALGVIGPVNYSMSPGVIASSSCASRYALLPAGIGLVVCAFVPALIALLSAIPNTVIGVILLYLMGTQLAAAIHMMGTTRSTLTFDDCLVVGLPLMMALLFSYIPMQVVPAIIRPIIGNGFVMGVITVIILEHVIFRRNGDNARQ